MQFSVNISKCTDSFVPIRKSSQCFRLDQVVVRQQIRITLNSLTLTYFRSLNNDSGKQKFEPKVNK
jgi:hypothetical protein